MTSEFVHLHNHSDYSLLDGAQRVDQLINTIGDLSMDSVALTELGNMFSVLPYYNEAKKAGIKPTLAASKILKVKNKKKYNFKPALSFLLRITEICFKVSLIT